MLFENVLNAAIAQRPKYKQAVGLAKTNLVDINIPASLSFIYSVLYIYCSLYARALFMAAVHSQMFQEHHV